MAESLGPVRRRAQRQRQLGADARCAACGEADVLVLYRVAGAIVCARCRRLARGESPLEANHPFGRANSAVTIPTDPNLHARWTDSQHDWPAATLVNPTGDPLLALAAAVRAVLTYGDVLLPALERVAEHLESEAADDPRDPHAP
jgi:hypothetical protein